MFLIAVQVVYNANKLADLVEKKKKMQNWFDYYRLKYERNPSERPTTKVCRQDKNDQIAILFFDVDFGLYISKLEYCISIFSINSLCFP